MLPKVKTCVLCERELQSVKRHCESVLSEMVNDPQLRKDLRHSQGYCARHAHLLLNSGSALGTCILYKDQIGAFDEVLRSLASSMVKTRRYATLGVWKTHKGCPACLVQEESRKRAISVLLKGLEEPDMRDAFENGSGFCVPHFFHVLESAKKMAIREYIIAVQRLKYQTLLNELSEFQRKNDYRFSHEPMGTEADSWSRAVRMIVGENDVF